MIEPFASGGLANDILAPRASRVLRDNHKPKRRPLAGPFL
jgi:hypothetical protein